MYMEIGLISDIHSNAEALECVLDFLNRQNIDFILCAGDIVGYYTQPDRTIRLLRIADIDSVLGNHDARLLDGNTSGFNVYAKRALDWNRRNISPINENYLRSLPETIDKEVGDKTLFVAHGSPKQPLTEYVSKKDVNEEFLQYSFDDIPDIVVLGHTHQGYSKMCNNTLVVNPGSVGQPRDGDWRASCAIIDSENLEVTHHRIEYDVEEVIDQTLEVLPRKLAERLREGE